MIWTIHAKPDSLGTYSATDMVAVPERSGAFAFLLPVVWLAWQRLWFALAVYVLLAALWVLALTTEYAPQAVLISLIPGFYVWLEGSQLRRGKLSRQGYNIIDLVHAPDLDTAIAGAAERMAEKPFSDAPTTANSASQRLATRAPRRQQDSVGLFGA